MKSPNAYAVRRSANAPDYRTIAYVSVLVLSVLSSIVLVVLTLIPLLHN